MRPVLLGLVLLCSCGGGATPVPPPSVTDLAGIWTLRTVNGMPLPFDIVGTPGRVPGDKYQLYAGTLELSPGLTHFGVRDSLRYTLNGVATDNVNGEDGSVTRNGSVFTLVGARTGATYGEHRRCVATKYARRERVWLYALGGALGRTIRDSETIFRVVTTTTKIRDAESRIESYRLSGPSVALTQLLDAKMADSSRR